MIFSCGFYISSAERAFLTATRAKATALEGEYKKMAEVIQANSNSFFGRPSGEFVGKCQKLFEEAKETSQKALRLEREINRSAWWRRLFNLVALGTMAYGGYKLGTNPVFIEKCSQLFRAIYGVAQSTAETVKATFDEQMTAACKNYPQPGTPGSQPSSGSTTQPQPEATPSCTSSGSTTQPQPEATPSFTSSNNTPG